MSTIQERVRSVMSKVFNIPAGEIADSSSPDTIEKWDSVGHLSLAVGIEQEFGIELSEDEIMELMNFQLICLTVQEKTA
jgi:acyl carrier protein